MNSRRTFLKLMTVAAALFGFGATPLAMPQLVKAKRREDFVNRTKWKWSTEGAPELVAIKYRVTVGNVYHVQYAYVLKPRLAQLPG